MDEKVNIDHINHDTLDNRRNNIRITLYNNNSTNRKGKNSNNKTGFRNVCKIKDWYRVQLQINGKNHLFKEKFDNAENAGIFAEQMRQKYYKDFAGFGEQNVK